MYIPGITAQVRDGANDDTGRLGQHGKVSTSRSIASRLQVCPNYSTYIHTIDNISDPTHHSLITHSLALRLRIMQYSRATPYPGGIKQTKKERKGHMNK
jgi:hypothetical protein